jgi:hypothetical protein
VPNISKLLSHGKTQKKLKGILLSEESQSDLNHMTSWKRQNSRDSKKISGCHGVSSGGGMNRNTEDFKGSENTPYVFMYICICLQVSIHLSKPTKCMAAKQNCSGLWVIIICTILWLSVVAHTCNPSYMGRGIWDNHAWKPALAKSE